MIIWLALAVHLTTPIATSNDGAVEPKDFVYLEHLRARALREQGCDGRRPGVGERRLKARYDRRFERVRDYFQSRYGEAKLQAERDDQFGSDYVMVGGCKVDRSGIALMHEERAYVSALNTIERHLRRTKSERD